jgi:hypothetical protein
VLFFGIFHAFRGLVFKYEFKDSSPWKLGMYLIDLICDVMCMISFTFIIDLTVVFDITS